MAVTIDGHKLVLWYGVDLEALKQKATRTRSDGAGGTIYTIPYRDIEGAIKGIPPEERRARDLERIREANAALACKGGE